MTANHNYQIKETFKELLNIQEFKQNKIEN